MAFTDVASKVAGDVFTEAMWDEQVRANVNAGVLRPIAETTLGSAQSSISFTSIAADHQHLLLSIKARLTTSALTEGVRLRFNNDTGANYYSQTHWGGGSTASAAETIAGTNIVLFSGPGSTATANRFATYLVWVPYYATDDREKFTLASMGRINTTTTTDWAGGEGMGVWVPTSPTAITRVDVLANANNLDTGTRVALWGVGGRA